MGDQAVGECQNQLWIRQADLFTNRKRQGRESGKETLDLRFEHVKPALGLVVRKKIYSQVFIARVRAPCFFIVSEEFRASGCQEFFSGPVPLAWTSVLDTFMSKPQVLAGPSS